MYTYLSTYTQTYIHTPKEAYETASYLFLFHGSYMASNEAHDTTMLGLEVKINHFYHHITQMVSQGVR